MLAKEERDEQEAIGPRSRDRAVTAVFGLGVVAGPAAAAPRECKQLQVQSMRAARAMEDYLGVNDNLWNLAYDWWLAVENRLESNGC